MSSLIKSTKLAQLILKNNPIYATAIRHHWNKDYLPSPVPKTKEEYAKAAEKYGLHPSEYKPFPDGDSIGYGDYPNLPMESLDSKDPFYPWDFPELKRNFQEPDLPMPLRGIPAGSGKLIDFFQLNAEFDLIREDRYDVSIRLRQPLWKYWAQFLGVMFSTFGLYMLLERVKMFPAVIPPQLPKDGKKHYTFETN